MVEGHGDMMGLCLGTKGGTPTNKLFEAVALWAGVKVFGDCSTFFHSKDVNRENLIIFCLEWNFLSRTQRVVVRNRAYARGVV